MEHRRLGGSGLKVSELCLGAMTFGEADEKSFMHGVGADEGASFAILDAAIAAGIDFIDTANVYGQDGLSERVVGRWMAERKSRDRVVLATKFRFRMWEGANGTGASRYHLVRACEDSLRRLGTDRIDLYQIHMQDSDVPEDEILRALDDLVRAGKVLYLGCSNYAAYRLMESLWSSDVRKTERFVALQAQYSLLVRDLEREHVPLCERHGIGILPWSPLAGGFLSGKYERGQQAKEGSRFASPRFQRNLAQFGNERGWRTVDAVKAIAKELGTTPTAVSLAWLLGKSAVSSVIFGARTVEQLNENLGASGLKLPESARKTLDDASAFEPGYPYGFIQQVQGRW
jgi:aryl-alcohol dehydrogenase-like predicted oxidoreductase